MMLTRSQVMSLERDGFMIIDHAEAGQHTHQEPNSSIPQVRPLLSADTDSSGFSSSSSSSYYTANTSFSISSSSSLYFTPDASFEEEKPGEYLLKDGSTRHILSVETPENIARKQQITAEQTAERELEALLKERDLAHNPEDHGFDMDVYSEPEPWGNDDDARATFIPDNTSMTKPGGIAIRAEVADT